jgi:hypothetical protein
VQDSGVHKPAVLGLGADLARARDAVAGCLEIAAGVAGETNITPQVSRDGCGRPLSVILKIVVASQ